MTNQLFVNFSSAGRAKTYWSDTISHEATGVTYYFAGPVEYGYYWNGDIFVVSNGGDITITQMTPEWSGVGRVMHGAMLQPDETQSNGFDDGTSYRTYQPSTNVDPAATGSALVIDAATHPNGASLVKAVSLEDLSTQRRWSVIDKYSVLTITPEIPPENAFRPPVAGTDKTSTYALADLDFSKLQSVAPVAGQPPISDFDYLAEATNVSWWAASWILIGFHPNAYHVGYNDDQLDDLVGAFMALHSNYSSAEKTNLYAAIVQHGLDYAGSAVSGNTFPADGGHGNLYKPFVVTAASALNSTELESVAKTSGVFSEDTQFRYIESQDIGVDFHSSVGNQITMLGKQYQEVHLGMPEWTIRDRADGRFDPSLDAAYRWINSDNVPILALTMEMLGNGEGREIWGNEAYFDYAERVRLMHEIDVTPTIASDTHTHMAEPEWMAFLDAYHGTFSSGANMQFRPEAPLKVTASVIDGGLAITISGEVFFGSAPVERVDIRYKAAADAEWTVVSDFGMSGQITGLTEGNLYFAQARYVNAIGEGPWSYNGFEVDNEYIVARLQADGLTASSSTSSEAYKGHLRSILSGDAGYEEIADDLLAATVTVVPPPPLPGLLDFNSMTIEDFQPGQNDFGSHTVSADGMTLNLDSQAWQSVIININLTADAWLSFDFSANVEGEIHGVMFANGQDQTAPDTAFNLYGTQDWGIQDYAYTGAGAVQRFEIPVGTYFIGSFDRIVFFTDDDANVGADSTFANVSLTRGGPPV